MGREEGGGFRMGNTFIPVAAYVKFKNKIKFKIFKKKKKSLFQHHSSKSSILKNSAFFIVQLSHPYLTTGETIALFDRPLLAK